MAGNSASKPVLKLLPSYAARTVLKQLPARDCQPAAQSPREAQTQTPEHSPLEAFWFGAMTKGPSRNISEALLPAATCPIGATCKLQFSEALNGIQMLSYSFGCCSLPTGPLQQLCLIWSIARWLLPAHGLHRKRREMLGNTQDMPHSRKEFRRRSRGRFSK